jgi:hypothetical protein
MTVKPKNLDAVPVGRIFLALENPRHDPFESEAQVIEYSGHDRARFSSARALRLFE